MPNEILTFANFTFKILSRTTKVIVGRGIRDEERFFLNWGEYVEALGRVGGGLGAQAKELGERYDGRRMDRGAFEDLLKFQERFREILDHICRARTIPPDIWAEIFRENSGLREVVKPIDDVFTSVGPAELAGLAFRREIRTGLYRHFLFASLRDLIVARKIFRFRRCPECRKFFFDETKNGRKIYCSPTSCGNRAKQRAFTRRRAANEPGAKKRLP
ncbi:MAG: CGNR zinc finger domain-containing protein [Pseudomonadota bacterium]